RTSRYVCPIHPRTNASTHTSSHPRTYASAHTSTPAHADAEAHPCPHASSYTGADTDSRIRSALGGAGERGLREQCQSGQLRPF
ncbi:MAG: hypothetical protein KTV68_04775, partial [Acidimicrobiia bacterium]|nr:hypothetical protein [Acidimicrobiia bacterium]